jgi:hypothetical protein
VILKGEALEVSNVDSNIARKARQPGECDPTGRAMSSLMTDARCCCAAAVTSTSTVAASATHLLAIRRDPERFHVEKSCICQDLEQVAQQLDQRADPQITVSRVRRSTSVAVIGGKRVAVQRHRDPHLSA